MTWRDRIQAASFRGVPFKVESSDNDYGRNLVVHEFPLREEVYVEDLGRKVKKFQIAAFVIGDDYMTARDALIKALSTVGTGELVHPYFGRLQVVVEGFQVRESSDQGRLVKITINFIEAGAKKFPTKVVNPQTSLNTTSDNLITASKDHFQANAVMSNVPDFVRSGVTSKTTVLGKAIKTLVNAGGLVNAVTSEVAGSRSYINNSAALFVQLGRLINPTTGLVGDTLTFSNFVQSTLSLINTLSSDGRAAIRVLKPTRDVEVTPVEEFTPNETTVNNNQTAVQEFIETIGIAEEAKATNNIVYESREDAIEVRTSLLDQIDYLMEKTSSDVVFNQLSQLKSDLITNIPPVSQDLPRLQTFKINNSSPSLVVAHEIYGSIVRADDIVTRNNVRHPGFVNAGDLQVLVNE